MGFYLYIISIGGDKIMEKSKVTPYSISDFIDTGLLRFVNIFLHIFGLALSYTVNEKGLIENPSIIQSLEYSKAASLF